jgi:hypothetical protein
MEVAKRHLTQLGTKLSAFVGGDRAAGVEVTCARRRKGRGNFALYRRNSRRFSEILGEPLSKSRELTIRNRRRVGCP